MLWFLLRVSMVDPAVPFTKGAAIASPYLVAMPPSVLLPHTK